MLKISFKNMNFLPISSHNKPYTHFFLFHHTEVQVSVAEWIGIRMPFFKDVINTLMWKNSTSLKTIEKYVCLNLQTVNKQVMISPHSSKTVHTYKNSWLRCWFAEKKRKEIIKIQSFFNWHILDVQYCMLQVYDTVIHNF